MQREAVIQCRALPGFRLWLKFADGAEGEVDLGHLAGRGAFAAWSDPAYFARVRIDPEGGTVSWPDGADLDPYMLYSSVTGAPLPGETRQTKAAG